MSRDYKPRPEITELYEYMVKIRRHCHINAETAFNEFDTAAYITKELKSMKGMQVINNIGGPTGVVGILRGKTERPCIGLRADIDALPLTEDPTGKVYASTRKGAMHACGHDTHIAMLLAAARVASEKWNSKMHGSIKFIFQPAEENGGGAKRMIEDGLLDVGGFDIDAFYGIHISSFAPVGMVFANVGTTMAGGDFFYITVNGVGGHGSAPHQTKDAIVIASHLITALQTVVSRNVDPQKGSVLSVGKIEAGSVANAIASTASMEGTVRFFEPEVKVLLRNRLTEICKGVAATFGVEIDIRYVDIFPALTNDKGPTELVRSIVSKITPHLGPAFKATGSEDFSRFLELRPGCFFNVGGKINDGKMRPHHSPLFDINEEAMLVGASCWVQLIEDMLVTQVIKDVAGGERRGVTKPAAAAVRL
ncbi:hypothetical protein SmJEL517_g01041 [Synchytrium microbalum]|uniref:Peptidase M20 dimerisation domain-containing protein n=1 Tax=Synchytrium microbalum TaxID=1806994 RepID=A0A507CHE5_9FUNG|nr:uncharacterized protein SmJEL517_g01041 [Synchytrium microbalum]TPX36993.1 hypothetical protein SmJEL517_g01041 [Synchytrium microbalum]